MTDRILEFLRARREAGRDTGPCLVVDLDVVRDNYNAFAKALPDTRVFYAVKANPEPQVLKLLADLGSCFDTASVVEIEQSLAADPSYGKTHYMLGMCYISQGENKKAKEHLEAFIAVAESGDADAATAKEMLSYLK